MLAKKKKLSKKQIKEDKLVTSYYQVQSFYEKHQSKILIILGSLAVIIVAIFWYTSRIEQQNESAAIELSRVIPLYNQGSYLEAMDGQPGTNVIGFKQIVDKYGGSEQGEVARLYLAHSLYYTGKFDEAFEQYDQYSGSNSVLSAAALAGKAACLEVKTDYEEAAKLYEKAAKLDESNPQNADYLLNAAKNALNASKADLAEELLNEIKSEYKNSTAANEVERYLTQVENL